jgi:predicted nucleotidyltransferase component of viral defense system
LKDFFERLNALGKPKRNDIIEKDFQLHRILTGISQDEYLSSNLVFKGGTCLMKAYTGYYRFSEDADFTWRDKSIWEGKSKSEIARSCSKEIGNLVVAFKSLADDLGLEFGGDKTKSDEVHISSGGKTVQAHIGYHSEVLDIDSRIKVEINFMDLISFPFVKKDLKSYVENVDSEEVKFLYEAQWMDYNQPVSLTCYDIKEIFVEKCRAMMTRKAYKLRDAIDIVFMEEKYGYSIPKFKKEIKKKTQFMLDLYERYRENIISLDFPSADLIGNEEMKLIIVPPPKGLEKMVDSVHKQLEKVRDDLVSSM